MKKFLIIFYIFICTCTSCFALTDKNWQSEIFKDIQADINTQNIQNKQNVFLFYEIYDSLCRKYGYKYAEQVYREKIPAKITVKSNTSSSDYQRVFERCKDEIVKGNFSNVSGELAKLNNNIEAEIEPERTETGYYTEFKTGIPEEKLYKEAMDIYKKKMYSTKPQPYSVVNEIKKYKNLKEDNMRFICEQFKNRMDTTEKAPDRAEYSNIYKNDCDWSVSPETFKSNAIELDKKYARYYPQNLY